MPRKRRTHPQLPRRVSAPGGPVRVMVGKGQPADDKGNDCYGTWDEATRVIHIDATSSPTQQWRTLYHELTHVALSDSGIEEMLTHEASEAICDALATARMRETFG
jgi:Zn-dependent peptidase ImmA (M78 family)